jgi:predicted TIM-barrel fold metal-dependent hydrolase
MGLSILFLASWGNKPMKVAFVILSSIALLMLQPQGGVQPPLVDHHQHLFSVETTRLSRIEPLDAADLIAYLDAAGIRRAAVLSVAYQFGNPNRPVIENEYGQVRAENDWTSRQIARFPDRLRGLCGVNPLKDYALPELDRCAGDPFLRAGLKLHFGNSDVDLDNAEHVQLLRRVFRAANDRGMAIVVHMRPSVTKQRPYGRKQAQTFLDELLPAAPDIPIQIAHLTGGGSYDEPSTDEALSVFIEAITHGDSRMTHVYFDVSGIAGYGKWTDKADRIVERIRQIGVQRIVFGSDGARGGGLAPSDAWADFLKLPLSDAEKQAIARNVAPYMN